MVIVNDKLVKDLKGIIYHKNDVIGVCDNAETLLDLQCQIKEEQSDDYKMEVEVETSKNSKRTFVYRFTKEGKMIPSSYPGVTLWTDALNKKLLYLYNFSISHNFRL